MAAASAQLWRLLYGSWPSGELPPPRLTQARQVLVGLEPAGSGRGHGRIEIVDKDRHDALTRAVGVFQDVDRPMLGKRPLRLGGVGEDVRSPSTRSYHGRTA